MSEQNFKTVVCPECGAELQIPQQLTEYSCMYCGARLSDSVPQPLDEASAEELEAVCAALISCVTGYPDYNQKITRDLYAPSFDTYRAGCAPVFARLNAAARTDEQIAAAADRLLDDLAAAWDGEKSKTARQRRMTDDKIIVAIFLVPMVRALGERWDGSGNSMLTASILLAIMVLPTIIGVVEPALRAVPQSYYEGALALGATHERSVYTAVVPAAKSGILAGVVLGVGRAMGETMAVIMVAGNQPRMPKGILQGVRTLTGNIVIEMGYAAGLHREALIATGVVLFVFILLMNLCFSVLKRGKKA